MTTKTILCCISSKRWPLSLTEIQLIKTGLKWQGQDRYKHQ